MSNVLDILGGTAVPSTIKDRIDTGILEVIHKTDVIINYGKY